MIFALWGRFLALPAGGPGVAPIFATCGVVARPLYRSASAIFTTHKESNPCHP